MTASVSSWCRGNPYSTSALASISPAQCAMLVASNGISAGNGGWGYECPQCRYLLVDMGPDRRPYRFLNPSSEPRAFAMGMPAYFQPRTLMPNPNDVQLNPPGSWDEFEDICADLF